VIPALHSSSAQDNDQPNSNTVLIPVSAGVAHFLWSDQCLLWFVQRLFGPYTINVPFTRGICDSCHISCVLLL
jgi:hypothetical protein